MKKFLAFQILIALVIGAVIGHFFPDFGMALRPVGDGFIRLIKMIVVPIVFSTIVIGAACGKRQYETNGESRVKDDYLV
ncbi:hypothetical protein PMEGAPL103_29430 [Priestia megaterium]